MVEYRYESVEQATAVPEKGILALRQSQNEIELYSADQRLTSDEARQLILEPLMFPTTRSDPAATGK